MMYDISLPSSWPEISFLFRASGQIAKSRLLSQEVAHECLWTDNGVEGRSLVLFVSISPIVQ